MGTSRFTYLLLAVYEYIYLLELENDFSKFFCELDLGKTLIFGTGLIWIATFILFFDWVVGDWESRYIQLHPKKKKNKLAIIRYFFWLDKCLFIDD